MFVSLLYVSLICAYSEITSLSCECLVKIMLICVSCENLFAHALVRTNTHHTHTAMYEPLGGVFIGSGEAQSKPALFVVSCGEGHLDLRTADKVLQTLHAKETGQSGLPSPASIISDKNYIMVWDVNS